MKYENYDEQKILYERFIKNSNLKDFDKIKKLSDNTNHNYSYSNKKKFNVKNLFHSYKFDDSSYEIFKKLKTKANNDYFNDNDIRESYTPNEINNFKLDFKNVIYDPQYKNKCLKGNYKWGNMKFNMQKQNMAKRRGISFEELKMHKIDRAANKKNTMEINGKMIIGGGTNHDNNLYNHKNINKTENPIEYNKKMIIDTMNKNSDFIKRKYSGKINVRALNNQHSNSSNDNAIFDLVG